MSYYESQYTQVERGVPPAPQVPFPWRAMWDAPAGRYLFINEQSGERTFDFPQQYPPRGGYGGYGDQQQYPPQRGYGGNEYIQQNTEIIEQNRPKQHHYGEMALAGAAGLAGGALLMHEGEKIHNDYEYDKYGAEQDVDDAGRYVERKWDNGVNDVENFPDDAARWTGNEVQRVEDIPQDIEYHVDNGIQDVEDIPDDVARWGGEKVGDVERFGDGIENSYDQGRDDRRYEDDYRDDNNNRNW